MSQRTKYPAGVPCWVETLQPDRRAAHDFYSELFGWQLDDSPDDGYAVARLRGREVAGIAALPEEPAGLGAAWVTHVRVDDAAVAAQAAAAAGGTVLREAFEAEPAGRLAVVADPGGALLCVWEAMGREGAELVNEPGAWAMSALRTPDPETAITFYGAVFGWEPEAFGPVTLLRLPGYVGGEPGQPVPRDVVAVLVADRESPARWNVDFWVGDADATAARAYELGGTAALAPHDAPPFRRAILADPQGATFSVSQLVAS